jgi:hypothetical protein
MKKLQLLALALAVSVPCFSASITLSPAVAVINGTGSVNVNVSGLTDILTTFDLDIQFDPLLVQVSSVTFGSLLGGPGDSIRVNGVTANTLDLFELSLLDDADLTLLQPNGFTLATINFQALGNGSAPLTITQAELFGSGGLALATPTIVNDRLDITLGQVPEPGSWALIGAGLLALPLVRRIRRS